MNLCITTCAVFPEDQVQSRLRIFLASAQKAMGKRQYPVIPYGIGERWTIYRDIKLTKQLAHLKSDVMRTFSHILYSDGSDAFFCGPIDEIVTKYEDMGSPSLLVSASHHLANVSDEQKQYPGAFEHDTKYCYPHVGGWIGEKDAMIAAFERMELEENKTSDDCFSWFDAWRDGWFRPQLDSKCEIFQVTDEDCIVGNLHGSEHNLPIETEAGRFHSLNVHQRLENTHTGTNPCILHMAGGYHDPVHGKDYAIEPWAKRLGIFSEAASWYSSLI